jgi:acylphosphatase
MEIRIRGRVQGVGFRPTVWRFACELRLNGEVFNDAEGVMVRAGGRKAPLRRLSREFQASRRRWLGSSPLRQPILTAHCQPIFASAKAAQAT